MKKKIALVTGGYSSEATISYRTAKNIFTQLDQTRFEVYWIDIKNEGWFYEQPDGTLQTVDKNDFSISANGTKINFDGVYIAMHGTPGEDGKLQGYFDMLGLPYTSCNATTSAITFNKRYTVAIAASSGIHVSNSIHLLKHTPYRVEDILNRLRLPVFVKPNNGGSSIGMSKVSRPEELAEAIEKAFGEDEQVLVEEMITGREFTIGVYKSKGSIITLPMTEIETHADKVFFDFEAKYQGKSDETTPADASADIHEKVSEAAKKIYQVFNCSGVIRIDFIYNEAQGIPYMLEINTIPGQSDASVVPQQVRAAGMTLDAFYNSLLSEAIES